MSFTPEEVRECFNESFLASFFPQLTSATGQEYLLSISGYAISCGAGKYMAMNCPDNFCCWAIHYIAYTLSSWARVEIDDANNLVNLPDPSQSQPAVYLKEKQIGEKTCKWELIDVKKACSPCPPSAMDAWKAQYEELMTCCETVTVGIPMGGGTYSHKIGCLPCCSVSDRRAWEY